MTDNVNERLDRIEANMAKLSRLLALELSDDEIEALEIARKLFLLVNVPDHGRGRTVKLAGEIFELRGHPRVFTWEWR
jgi:hypothetical protein